ncbi:MAG: RNA-binding S4 domain-containing protein [Rhodobacteraceae bacterium]|uniref:RNA-binding S4 domain-containing protein n=1 Tax=Albidovulum sp. TaxID=1872424 RepID=UPI002659BB10|nr:RNA-binding S4 domain-containing protein [uncultured Defluviimonas sp.]MCC0069919.1 RNA-binding S4 domain-containing protein [Paracoccaceae bacterium]
MAEGERIRIDKWLWQARFCKTRSLAAEVVSAGRLRLNGARMAKPGHAVGPGDVLTFPQGGQVRVVRILACGSRRGPAPEARGLYDDLAPPAVPKTSVPPAAAAED